MQVTERHYRGTGERDSEERFDPARALRRKHRNSATRQTAFDEIARDSADTCFELSKRNRFAIVFDRDAIAAGTAHFDETRDQRALHRTWSSVFGARRRE